MFELSNKQRLTFALTPINEKWSRLELPQNNNFKTILFLEDTTIVKCILSGDSSYCEYELNEKVSEDRKYLLPKTAKGKPVLLSSSSIQKRTGVGMSLNYHEKNINLYNIKTECSYYFNSYIDDEFFDSNDFSHWVEKWCEETTDADIADITAFSQRNRKHVRYIEGDIFRFKIGRRLYGYGRILLDYDKMRKRKEPFWDIFMSKPLVCSVYHIVTERDNVTIEELKTLKSLPSTIIADNSLYYGEFEIIGNIPSTKNEDYPIMYGHSIDVREKAVCYQCGKVFKKIDNETELYCGFLNNGVSFNLNIKLNVLLQCIKEQSNQPYWDLYYPHEVNGDLRNPKFKDKLAEIQKHMKV